MAARAEVEATIQSFLTRVGKATRLTPDTQLFADGIGLDSMETAELSAILEDEYGADAFGEAELPETVGELYAFYENA